MNFLNKLTKIYFKNYSLTIKDFMMAQGMVFFWITLLLFANEFYTLIFFIANMFTSFVSLLDRKLFISKEELLMFSLEKTRLYLPSFLWQRILFDDIILNSYILLCIIGISVWSNQTIYLSYMLLIYFGFRLIEFFYFNERDRMDDSLITIKIMIHVVLMAIIFLVYIVFRPETLVNILNTNLFSFFVLMVAYGLVSYAIILLLRKYGHSESKLYSAFLQFLRNKDIHYYKEIKVFIAVYGRNVFSAATIVWIWVVGDNQLASRLGILIIYSFLLTMRTFSVQEKRKQLNLERDHMLMCHLVYKKDKVKWLKKKREISIIIGITLKIGVAIIISLLLNVFYLDLFLYFIILASLFSSIEFHLMLIKERIEQYQAVFIRFLSSLTFVLFILLELYNFFFVFFGIVMLFEILRFQHYLRRFV